MINPTYTDKISYLAIDDWLQENFHPLTIQGWSDEEYACYAMEARNELEKISNSENFKVHYIDSNVVSSLYQHIDSIANFIDHQESYDQEVQMERESRQYELSQMRSQQL